jgi:hypothetical protein
LQASITGELTCSAKKERKEKDEENSYSIWEKKKPIHRGRFG